MPPTKTIIKSPLLAKYGSNLDAAVKNHAADSTDYGFIRLPGGIDNGVAQLTQCYFKEYENGENKGEFYFRAVGNVISPLSIETPNGPFPLKGLQTSIMIAFCDTKTKAGKLTTQDENIAEILKEMRRLGGEQYTEGASAEDLESLAAGLVEAAPFFKFTTSQSAPSKEYPNPRVWENWHGTPGLEDFVPPEANAIVDKTPPVAAKAPVPAPKANGKPAKAPTPPPPVDPEPEPFVPESETDLDILLADAESDSDTSGSSQERLNALAVEAGCDAKKVEAATSWPAVVGMIQAAGNTESGDEGDGDGPASIQVGEEVWFHPKHPTTKKKVKDPVKATVTAVDEVKETLDLKAGKATYAKVPFAELVEEPAAA